MYNYNAMQKLICFIEQNKIADKDLLAKRVKQEFNLTKDRSVYYNDSFSIRFCKSAQRSFGNTVLSLSALRKYDDLPFVVCLVTPVENYLMLANTTFLKKVSHSSQELRCDNIKGSFNGSDIVREYGEVENIPENFEALFTSHANYTFEENLVRLVEATNNIAPVGKKFVPNEKQLNRIYDSIKRAVSFMKSNEYHVLDDDLNTRVHSVKSEIVIASLIPNVNMRGRIIEYLITAEDSLKSTLVECLRTNHPLPKIFTADKLGDYERIFEDYVTATDIKTKVLFLSSNPKGYNIDKLLSFLSEDQSVYLVYIVAIDADKSIKTKLCSMYNCQILSGTRIIMHWAGRNSRGVTQYEGKKLEEIVDHFDNIIDANSAKRFLDTLLLETAPDKDQ